MLLVALSAFPVGVCELDSGAAAGGAPALGRGKMAVYSKLAEPAWRSGDCREYHKMLQLGAGDGSGAIVLDIFY